MLRNMVWDASTIWNDSLNTHQTSFESGRNTVCVWSFDIRTVSPSLWVCFSAVLFPFPTSITILTINSAQNQNFRYYSNRTKCFPGQLNLRSPEDIRVHMFSSKVFHLVGIFSSILKTAKCLIQQAENKTLTFLSESRSCRSNKTANNLSRFLILSSNINKRNSLHTLPHFFLMHNI